MPTVIDCTENDFMLSLMVNSDSNGDFFSVSDNLGNDLGDFYYTDVTITLGPLPLEVTSLTVSDSENSECTIQTGDLTAAVQECIEGLASCSVSVASAEVSSCTEESYTLQLNISAMDAGASFSVSDASGNDLGSYNYADVPVEISGISVTENLLTITDDENADCSTNTNDLANDIQICLGDPPTCSITSAVAMLTTCTENDYAAMVMVTGENTGSTFTITDAAGNDLGTYNYADSPIELNGIATTSSVFTITDNDDADCTATTNNLADDIQTCLDGFVDMTNQCFR